MEEKLENELCKAEKDQEHICEHGKQNQDFAELADEQQTKKKISANVFQLGLGRLTGVFAALTELQLFGYQVIFLLWEDDSSFGCIPGLLRYMLDYLQGYSTEAPRHYSRPPNLYQQQTTIKSRSHYPTTSLGLSLVGVQKDERRELVVTELRLLTSADLRPVMLLPRTGDD